MAELFREDRKGARSVDNALRWLLATDRPTRPILVIDLSREQAQGMLWNDKIQSLVIKRLLDGLERNAERFYKEDQSLNALVVIDEAHRLAPRQLPREDEAARGVRSVLIDAARTTRKYGLGWLFISQGRCRAFIPRSCNSFVSSFLASAWVSGRSSSLSGNSSVHPVRRSTCTSCSVTRTRPSTPRAVSTRS